MSWIGDLRRASALPWSKRWLVVESAAWLGLMRAALLVVPFRFITSGVGLRLVDGAGQGEVVAGGGRAEDVGWALRAAAARTPWGSTCLVQSLAGHVMLALRHQPSEVFLGVAKDLNGEVIAHSWLRSGDTVLTGGKNLERFTPLAAYRSARLTPVPPLPGRPAR